MRTVAGGPATSQSAKTPWEAPPSSANQSVVTLATLPPDLAARGTALTLADLVGLALDRNPTTRVAWASARASAARLGDTRSDYFPRLEAGASVTQSGNTASNGRTSSQQTTISPSLSMNWLLFDIGGRSGSVGAADAALRVANWDQNAVLSDLVRRTAQAYFTFAGTKSLLDAERATWEQAKINLSVAEDRRTVGVATIADVLQARTAAAQALLAVQSAEGAVATTRGALATLAGLSPAVRFEIDSSAALAPIGAISDSVEMYIEHALRQRPDLAAARALAEQRHQQMRVVDAQRRPSLALTGNAGRTSYQVGIGVSIPLFNGYGWEFASQAAALVAEAQDAQTAVAERDVALDVFITYQSLRTATQRVRASDDLLNSASASADASRARFRGEVGTLIELLNAESALADARAQQIQSRVQWQTALVQLAHDAGFLRLDGVAPLKLTPLPALRDSIR